MISWDFMIAMAQMNIAFGILYVTWPSARYRKNAYEVFVEQYNSCGDHGYGHYVVNFNKEFENAVHRNERLSDHYFFVKKWARELPKNFREQLMCDEQSREAVDSLIFQTDAENTQSEACSTAKLSLFEDPDLLKRHAQFKKDWDRNLVWGLTIVPSALFVYIAHLSILLTFGYLGFISGGYC